MLLRDVQLIAPVCVPGFKGSRFTSDGPQKNVDSIDYRFDLFGVLVFNGGRHKLIPLSNVGACEFLDESDLGADLGDGKPKRRGKGGPDAAA